MPNLTPYVWRLALLLLALGAFVACGDDDAASGGTPTASPEGFFFPEPFTTEEALAELDVIQRMVSLPDIEAIQRYEISEADLRARIDLILSGESETSGLDDARAALEDGDRILAGEYLHNVVLKYVTPSFGGDDAVTIGSEELGEIDPAGLFVEDPEQGLSVTAVFREAAVRMIKLRYRL